MGNNDTELYIVDFFVYYVSWNDVIRYYSSVSLIQVVQDGLLSQKLVLPDYKFARYY